MRALVAVLLASLPLVGAAALEAPVAIRPTLGVLFETLLDPSLSTPGAAVRVPSPSINFNFGCGVIMPFAPDSYFSFEPSADIYYYNAEITPAGQALPTFEEYSSAFVLGLLIDAPVVFSMTVGQKFSFGVGAGLCLDARVAFPVAGALSPDAPAASNQYYWGKARFLMPSTLLRAEYALTDRVGFGITGRFLWPIYNLWTGEGFGFFDQSKYLIDLTIRYKLGGSTKAGAATSAAGGDASSAPAAPPAAAAGGADSSPPPSSAPVAK